MAAEKRDPARRPDGMPVGKPFQPGVSANPGGKPKKLREIEEMLDAEHRNVENLRPVFAQLRDLAMGVSKPVYQQGALVGEEMVYEVGFMKLYLDRVLGPVKDQVTEEDLSELSDETLNEIRGKLRLVK